MKVAHIGPPVARGGGPTGYLLVLREAAQNDPNVLFPPVAPAPAPPKPPTLKSVVRKKAGKLKRALLGTPKYFRPQESELQKLGGLLNEGMRDLAQRSIAQAERSLEQALGKPKIGALFCHDPLVARHLLQIPGRQQQVWLFIHAPMPLALYHAWCFGVPERPWEEVLRFPDVAEWTRIERETWAKADRLIFPCLEAAEAFVAFGDEFGPFAKSAHYLLTGASVNARRGSNPNELRQRWGLEGARRVGLLLGSNQPYRGLDILLASIPRLGKSDPGDLIAIAGPDADSIPAHPRVRALGRVSEVAELLEIVDFVINLNRFSLFDLSLIEACQAGKPLLLSNEGGNRTFARLGAGCRLLSSLRPEDVARGIDAMFAASNEEVARLGKASAACYAKELTLERFWERHRSFYQT